MDNIVADAEAGTRFPLLLLEVFGGIACFPASACLESFLRPCKSGLLSSISGSNTKFVRLLNVMALVFALGVMFAAAHVVKAGPHRARRLTLPKSSESSNFMPTMLTPGPVTILQKLFRFSIRPVSSLLRTENAPRMRSGGRTCRKA